MKTPDKTESEFLQTLARIRSANGRIHHDDAEDPDKLTQVNRQRVSPGLTRVDTRDRQDLLHAAIRDILLSKITQGEALRKLRVEGKRAARTVLTGMCYSVGSATRQGSSSLTR
ncbi:hypothetical protein L8Q94_22300, partial [Enterobacter kobei]|nr:hypothetical protein [Enterobacter kobei]